MIFMKRLFIILCVLTLLSCNQEQADLAESNEFIPPNATLILKFDDYSEWQSKVENQSFLTRHKDNAFIKYWSLKNWNNFINIPDDFILTYSTIGKNKLVKTIIFETQKDKTKNIDIKNSYQYNQVSIKFYENKTQNFYQANLGGQTIISSSKIILENIIRNYQGGIKAPETISKLLNILSDDSPSLVVNTELFSKLSNEFFIDQLPENIFKQSDYFGFDLNLTPEKILFSGIVFESNTQSDDWFNFKNVNPEPSVVAEVIPNYFISATSLMISDYQKYFLSEKSVNATTRNDSLWLKIKELTHIKLPTGEARALVSKNIDETFESLQRKAIPFKNFGSHQIYQLKEKFAIGERFKSLLKPQDVSYFVVFQDIIMCSDRLDILENIIIQVNNKNTLSKNNSYINHKESLTSESHILWLTNLEAQKDLIHNQIQDSYKNAFKKIDWSKHKLLMSQLIVEDDFAYLNILQQQIQESDDATQVRQVVRLTSETDILSHPQFFKNWRTGQRDVVYQDINNVLHLKDTKGNLIWSKPLDSPIVGDIKNIDIYKNKRIQLAFATQHKVYVLDKNGSEVKPFPLDFKDKITQSLSVFDYDNNGKYRFVVVMDKKIKMYNKEGKRVRGFKFKKAKTPLAFPMKHIRINRKDYILAQEESGYLNILSRTGRPRVNIKENLSHTDNNWHEHNKAFISVSDDGKILKINQNGILQYEDKGWINPKFTASEKYLVSMSENKLHINNRVNELPYGVYTKPLILDKYIVIADTQTQKIYLFNSQTNIIKGFPVYGQNINDAYLKSNTLFLLCQDEKEAIIIYEVKFNK